ncbi:TetR family transcriptional regulator [Nocardia sp. NPDC050697]|uniref:TetR/AcrR family transcriptional regulator n=1 Tax=Nocardia sp. NPDC050697 TaxID=3155158 RepID=UPI0033F216DF
MSGQRRPYSSVARDRAREQVRARILDAAGELFAPVWYDEVTLAGVAAAAGVSAQTVVNHFGGKIGLYRAALTERFLPAVYAGRANTVAGEVDSIVPTVAAGYELYGDGTWRLLALAERIPDVRSVVVEGVAAHREWVRAMFAPLLVARAPADAACIANLLTVALDVRTWRSLRRELGLGPDATRAFLTTLVHRILGSTPLTRPDRAAPR